MKNNNILKLLFWIFCFFFISVGIVIIFNPFQTIKFAEGGAKYLVGMCYIFVGFLVFLFIE
jgi:hypothetical protein